MQVDYRFNALERKSISDSGEFEGYGHLKNVVDAYGDSVEGDAVYTNLPDFIKDGFVPLGHDWSGLPVAFITDAIEDSKGLYLRGKFHGHQTAQDARAMVLERLDAGKSVGLSIGFWATEYKFEERDDRQLRIVSKMELAECSIVNLPAVPKAGIAGAKGAGLPFADEFSGVLAANESLIRRFAQIKETRARQWSNEKLTQLRDLEASLRQLADVVRDSSIESAPSEEVAKLMSELAAKGIR